jgi:hypothetical protein
LIKPFNTFCGTLKTGRSRPLPGPAGSRRRQGLQREAALAALQGQLGLVRRQRDGLVGRHRAQDVDQLPGADGRREVRTIAAEFGGRPHLDLEVAGRELDLRASLADQHVGEDRQRVTAFDDARDCLQRTQEFFLRSFQDNHVNLLTWS